MPTTSEPAELTAAALSKADLLHDYRLGWESRQASLAGRKEVFMGKAKFGIFGDGKELPQLAMARAFRPGDWRAGYYRDQTFMLALGELTLPQYFAQLYAHPDPAADPATAGRCMGGHFATRILDEDGRFPRLGYQLQLLGRHLAHGRPDAPPRGPGLRLQALPPNPRAAPVCAVFRPRQRGSVRHHRQRQHLGGHVLRGHQCSRRAPDSRCWFRSGTTTTASRCQAEYQTTKQSISAILQGFQREGEGQDGLENLRGAAAGTTRPYLTPTKRAAALCRTQHVPVLIHVTEVTQPQGHSTSGSHERYKNKERLGWEAEHDCLRKMREWLLTDGYATEQELKRHRE